MHAIFPNDSVKYLIAFLNNRGFRGNLMMKFAAVDVEKRRGQREREGTGLGSDSEKDKGRARIIINERT